MTSVLELPQTLAPPATPQEMGCVKLELCAGYITSTVYVPAMVPICCAVLGELLTISEPLLAHFFF